MRRVHSLKQILLETTKQGRDLLLSNEDDRITTRKATALFVVFGVL